MQAIVLAGGFGTRLRSVIKDVPKPMAPINNKPFLAYLLDYLILQGVNKVVLSVHYLREQIQEYFQDSYRNVAIEYAIEDEPLGTGGAILKSLAFVKHDQPVFVLNGDTFLKLNYRAMYSQHAETKSFLTMALRKISDCSRYGEVFVNENIVCEFKEKGGHSPGLINAGVYLITPFLLKSVSFPEKFSFERDYLFPSIEKIRPHAFIVDEYFIDIGVPEDYEKASREL